MPMPPNLAELMQNITRFHEEAAKVHARILNPKQREILAQAMDELKSAHADVEQTLPKTLDMLKAKAEKAMKETAEFQAAQPQREAERKAALERAKAAAAQRRAQKQAVIDSVRKPQKPKLPQAPMPKEWGRRLSGELIERYGRPDPVDLPPAARAGEIWEDWQWEGRE